MSRWLIGFTMVMLLAITVTLYIAGAQESSPPAISAETLF